MYSWAFSASQRNQHQEISPFSYVSIDNRPFFVTALVDRKALHILYMSGLLSRDLSNQFCLYLVHDALITLICAFVLSRIDYCNSHLARCTKKSICKLQKLQSSAARLICRSAGSAHTSPCSALASCRIPHNHSTKCFFLSTTSLSDLIQLYLIFCHLRSSASVCSPASGRRA